MALTFPANPTNGQIYDQYVYDATAQSWRVYGSDTGITNVLATKANLSGGNTFSGNQTFQGYVLKTNQPRFQAFGASGSSGNSGVDWIFPSTYMNLGSNYNTSNGRFTAPIAGAYVFFWSNIGNTQNTVYRYRIRKNGVNIDDVHLRLETGTTSYKENGVMMIVLDLAPNDYVNIFFQSDNNTASFTTGQYPWFGGYLLG
jgi:hypothetical protein